MERILPDTFEYEIEKCFINEKDFEAVLRLKCKTEEELLGWKRDLEHKTGSVWIVRSTYPNASKFVCRRDYVCQRSQYKKTAQDGHEYCIAKMSLKVKKDTVNTRRRDQFVKRGFLSEVKMLWSHNHLLGSAASTEDHQQDKRRKFVHEGSETASSLANTDGETTAERDSGQETQESTEHGGQESTKVDTGIQTDPSPVASNYEAMENEPCDIGHLSAECRSYQLEAASNCAESIVPVSSSMPISEQRPAVTVGQTVLFSTFSFAFVGMVESDFQKAAVRIIIGKLGGNLLSHVERAKQRAEKTGGTVVGLADKHNHRTAKLFSSLYNITVIDMNWILHCFEKSELLSFTEYLLGR